MPVTPTFCASSYDMLHDLFSEWVSSMISFSAEIESQLPELLIVLLDPLDDVVATILVQGYGLAVLEPLRLLFTPLADVLFNLLMV